MNRCFQVPLSLALLGLLVSACDTPEDNETNDEAETETDTSESDSTDGETDAETETDTSSSSTDDAESSSSSSSDDADTMDTDDTDGPECDCIADQEESEQPMMPLCGESLCDVVSRTDGEEDLPVVTTPEALECALTALRDRTPGYVQWGSDYNTGQFSEYGYVLIQENGEAIWREWGANDLTYDASPALRFALPDPSHYETCLAEPDANERYFCLRYPPNPDLGMCEAGWSDSGI